MPDQKTAAAPFLFRPPAADTGGISGLTGVNPGAVRADRPGVS